MSTQTSINVMGMCLLIIGFLVYLHELPHRKARYNHRNCDFCEEVRRGRRPVPPKSRHQDGTLTRSHS